jgi:hypothetical protein
VEQQDREQRALASAAEVERPTVGDDLEGAEDPELHA